MYSISTECFSFFGRERPRRRNLGPGRKSLPSIDLAADYPVAPMWWATYIYVRLLDFFRICRRTCSIFSLECPHMEGVA